MNEMAIFAGNANMQLAKDICKHLRVPLTEALVGRFSEGEIRIQIKDNIRGKDVFIVQPTCPPPNENLMELLILIDAIRRASATRVTAVLPYYGYARQDRKDQPRVPITAKLVADLIATAGAHRVLTVDLHAGQIQGFFNIPVDHLYATPVLLDHFRQVGFDDLVVVSPDAGGVERARAFAKRLKASLAIIDKRREGPNQAKVMNIIGEVNRRNVLLLDDMIDTAGTITQGANALRDKGAKTILAGCTHAVLSGPALDRINASPLDTLVVTNTLPLNGKEDLCRKLVSLTVAPLLGEAIKRIHEEESVSSLFV